MLIQLLYYCSYYRVFFFFRLSLFVTLPLRPPPRRLSEFKNTPSSSLTVEEFLTVDLEDEMDPPAFTKSRKKDKERISQARAAQDAATGPMRGGLDERGGYFVIVKHSHKGSSVYV